MTGVMLRSDRKVIRMFGRDPLKMIQGLATNDIAGAAEDASVYTAFLTPKGKMVGDARVTRRPGGDIWIEADAAAATNIQTYLKKYVPPLFARFELVQSLSVLGLYGDTAAVIAATLPCEVRLRNPFRADALDAIVPAESAKDAEAEARRHGAYAIDPDALEVMRIEAGEPKWGNELTEEVIPLEAGLREVAISESKGCYTGQEVIVRILHRGHVNRLLRGIRAGSGELPSVGAELTDTENGKAVGRITSACYSPSLGQAIALAYVRREIEPPAILLLEGRDVSMVALPFDGIKHGAKA